MWDYTDKVREHFLNPRNVGEVEDPDGVAEVGSIACGDALKLTFKVDENRRITDAKFKTFGCASAIASASALTEMIKGMTIEEAEKVTNQDIAKYLGGLPQEKMHCSVMGREALEAAIHNYRTGETMIKNLEDHIVCTCFGVSENEIRRVVTENSLTTVDEVTNFCKAGGGCGMCRDDIQAIIDGVRDAAQTDHPKPPAAAPKKRLPNLQKMKMIEEIIDREIRPQLQKDGGDIELIDVVDNRVLVATRGACATCKASDITMKHFVETKLREFVTPELTVEEVTK